MSHIDVRWEDITGLYPGLIMVTENHHHAQVPLSYPITEEDHWIGGFPHSSLGWLG